MRVVNKIIGAATVALMLSVTMLTQAQAYDYPEDDGKPVTVYSIKENEWSAIGGSNARNPDICMDRTKYFNAVIYVKYVDLDGKTLGYSDDFRFSVEAFNPYPNAGGSDGRRWNDFWNEQFQPGHQWYPGYVNRPVTISIDQRQVTHGPGPVRIDEPIHKCSPPSLNDKKRKEPAYAFRDFNSESYALTCLGNFARYSNGFIFKVIGNEPGDAPRGKTGKWLQREYKANPYGERKIDDLNRSFMAIEFKYQVNVGRPPEYNLTPQISVTDKDIEEGVTTHVGGVTSSITNSGPDKSQTTRGITSRFIVRKSDRNTSIDNNIANRNVQQNGSVPRDYVESRFRGTQYSELRSVNQVFNVTSGGSSIKLVSNASEAIAAFNLKIGDRLCYMTSIQRPKYSDSTSVWRHSAPACLTVGVRPHMQVRSGDIMVDGKIIAGATNRQGRTYGSWGEYAAIAGGKINAGGAGFGSGAIYRMGAAGAAPNKGFLSFSNNYGTNHGNFGEPIGSNFSALADYLAKLTPTSSAHNRSNVSSIDLDTLTTPGRYIISRPSGEIKVRGDLRKGVSVIVLAKHNQTVTIDGNITTPDTYDSVRELSQLAIVASAGSEQKVNINPGVTRADAWIIVPGGTINTCRESGAPKRAGGCANTLFVNGPVIAKDFLLRRTGGEDKVSSGAAKQSMPAEVFNLRPDAYLWTTNQVNNSGARYVTTQSIELPPQY